MRRAGVGFLFVWFSISAFAQAPVCTKANDCTTTSCGTHTTMVPLIDLGLGTYKGFEGGLYPGGANVMPATLKQDVLTQIFQEIRPRDAAGNVDLVNGKIGLGSVGMSNTTREFRELVTMAKADPELSPYFVSFDGAKGGRAALDWLDPDNDVWTNFVAKFSAEGLAAPQVQVLWMKQSGRAKEESDTFQADGQSNFPTNAARVQGWLTTLLQMLKANYPNLKLVYLSSRTYAGYSNGKLHPEPFAYENGFAVKWLIEEQLVNQNPELEWRGENAVAPLVCWGPYLWADGLGADGVLGGIPGNSEGLEWECQDFDTDGTHPSDFIGSIKVADLILDWLKQDETARWLLKSNAGAAGIYTLAGENPPEAEITAPAGATDVVLAQFAVQPHYASQDVMLEEFTIQATGTGHDGDHLRAVKLYADANGDGAVDAADSLVASGSFDGDNGTALLVAGTAPLLVAGKPQSFVLAVDVIDEEVASLPRGGMYLAFLIPFGFLAFRGHQRSRLVLFLLIGLSLPAVSCRGGGGSGGPDSPPPGSTSLSGFTFSLSLESMKARSALDGVDAFQVGLPVGGSVLAIQ